MADILGRFSDLAPTRFAAGEMLIRAGGDGGQLLVLRSGAVTVQREGVVVARIDAPGAVFGEMSLLLERPHTASVIAETPVEAYRIADGLTFLRERPAIALHVAVLIAQRLESTAGYVGELKAGAVEKRHDTGIFERLIGFLTGHPAGEKPAPPQPRPR